MKRIVFSALLVCLVTAPVAAQTVRDVTIESTELDQTREILIYEPMNYEHNEFAYYDVIYVFDAQVRLLSDYVNAVANLSKGGPRGVIVVGIKATNDEEALYGRNHDLLPSDTEWNLGPKSGGNAEAFLAYVKNEVVPYVESNYRVLPHRTAVGHSLSASFVVYTLLHETGLFDNYIAVSPNLEFDDHRLVHGLRAFDSEQFDTPVLFYMSHADENEAIPSWKAANDVAYPLLEDTLANQNFRVVTEQYPEEGHMSGFMPSVRSAIRTYLDEVRPAQMSDLSGERYEVTFRVQVPDAGDEIWISGNQGSLGNWASDQIKMKRVSPLVREVTVQVQDHVEVKFYGAEGDSQAWIQTGEPSQWGIPRSTWPMMIRPEDGETYAFNIVGYTN